MMKKVESLAVLLVLMVMVVRVELCVVFYPNPPGPGGEGEVKDDEDLRTKIPQGCRERSKWRLVIHERSRVSVERR